MKTEWTLRVDLRNGSTVTFGPGPRDEVANALRAVELCESGKAPWVELQGANKVEVRIFTADIRNVRVS